MLKRAGRDALIVLGIVVIGLSTSRTAMQFISDHRDNNEWWGNHQLDHGDLSSMAHLDYLNKFSSSARHNIKRAVYDGPKSTVLFLHGDSYTWKLKDSVFAGVSEYEYIGWSNPHKYHLDTTKRNVLVIEVSERLLREYYGSTQIIDQMTDTGGHPGTTSGIMPYEQQTEVYSSVVPDFKISDLFNKNINQNLEYNLFNYKFMMPMFGWKAAINCYLFGRASGDVVISDDRQFLFYKETLDPQAKGSSFSPLPDSEVSRLVNNFNLIYDYYKASGFKEIYLSVIPNTVTIMQPKGYNNLIPKVQNDPRLKMKVIDMYATCKSSAEQLFAPGDTHWSERGQQVWVDMVNEVLVHPRSETRFK